MYIDIRWLLCLILLILFVEWYACRYEWSTVTQFGVLRYRFDCWLKSLQFWKPEVDFEWELPDKYVVHREDGAHIHVDSDVLGPSYMKTLNEWRDDNPAPWWWKLWCRIVKRSAYTNQGLLGAAFDSIPTCVTENTTVHLSGVFDTSPYDYCGVVLKRGHNLIVDGGPPPPDDDTEYDAHGNVIVYDSDNCADVFDLKKYEYIGESDAQWFEDEFAGYQVMIEFTTGAVDYVPIRSSTTNKLYFAIIRPGFKLTGRETFKIVKPATEIGHGWADIDKGWEDNEHT